MLLDSVTRGTKVVRVTAGPATIALGLLVTWSVISNPDLFDKVKRCGMMPLNKMCMPSTRGRGYGQLEAAEASMALTAPVAVLSCGLFAWFIAFLSNRVMAAKHGALTCYKSTHSSMVRNEVFGMHKMRRYSKVLTRRFDTWTGSPMCRVLAC